METHIPVLVRKTETIKFPNIMEPLIEGCNSCENKLFYVVTTKGLVFNPYQDHDDTAKWDAYEIITAWTQHICATCGQTNGSIGHWEHSIMEYEDKSDCEDYHHALEYLRTGKISNDVYLPSDVLRKAEELKTAVARYWTERNITDAITRARAEQIAKSTEKEVREQ